MIYREFGKQSLICDRCDDELGSFFSTDEFETMIQHAKEDGWAIRMEGGFWRHYCRDCKSDDRLARQRKLLGL